MIYAKHPEFGNKHFACDRGSEQAKKLQAQGWVIWPRTADEKAGKVSAPPAQPPAVVMSPRSTAEPVAPPFPEEPRRGPGRPPKVR